MQLSEVSYSLTKLVKSYNTVSLFTLMTLRILGIPMTPAHLANQQVGSETKRRFHFGRVLPPSKTDLFQESMIKETTHVHSPTKVKKSIQSLKVSDFFIYGERIINSYD